MLKRKMLRDLLENKGNYLTCILIIIMGIMFFSSLDILTKTIYSAQERFYQEQNFADGFIQIKNITPSQIAALQKIKGIKEIEGRLVKDIALQRPKADDHISLRLISLNPHAGNSINTPKLHLGDVIRDNELEIWVDNKFFEAHQLALEDQLELIINGKKQKFVIKGVVSSPEFVYALKDETSIFPDPDTFGIAFISWNTMKKLFSDTNYFNELVFTLKAGADYDLIAEELNKKLTPHGLIRIYPREEQSSHFLLDLELVSLKAMTTSIPILFLGVSSIVLYISLKRLIEQQRGQIGILKAEGYTSWEILFHYLSYGLVIGLTGGLTGAILGSLLSYPLVDLFADFFNLPNLKGSFSLSSLLLGTFLSISFSLIACYQGGKRILKLKPAEAMRPPAPIEGKKVLIEKLRLIWKKLTVQGQMAFRNLSRNKGRSLFIFTGIVLCFAISSFTLSMNDLLQKMLFDQYEKIEVYDVKVNLTSPLDQKRAQRELASFPGVWQVEPLLETPSTLSNRWLYEDVLILGLPKNSQLYNLLDSRYQKVDLPETGLLLSERLAKLLDAELGSILNFESPFQSQKKASQVKVAGIIPQYIGVNAYMELGALQKLIQQPQIATGFMVKILPDQIHPLEKKYLYSEKIASIEGRTQRLGKLIDLMASYADLVYIYAFMGVILGFVIIYSSATISIAERQRELASMMVLGMSSKEVLKVIAIEQWILGLPAMFLGIPASKLMMAWLAEAIDNDLFTMPKDISLSSLFFAFVITAFSIWLGQKGGARKINKINLTESLGARE